MVSTTAADAETKEIAHKAANAVLPIGTELFAWVPLVLVVVALVLVPPLLGVVAVDLVRRHTAVDWRSVARGRVYMTDSDCDGDWTVEDCERDNKTGTIGS